MWGSGLGRPFVRAASVALTAATLLVTSVTPSSAHDWDDDDRHGYGRYDDYDRGHYRGRGHGHGDWRHGGKHHRHNRHYRGYDHYYYGAPRATVVLPFPPPPPFFFPRVVFGGGHRHHHGCGH